MVAAIALLTFFSALLVTNGMRAKSADPVEVRLAAIRAGRRPMTDPLDRPFIDRAVAPAFVGLARIIMRFMPTTWVEDARQRLVWAGNPMPLPAFVVIWASMMLTFALVAFVVASSFQSALFMILITIFGAMFGAMMPRMWLRARCSERQYQARKSLPDMLDLMTTSVEAGLSLDAALVKVAETQQGPIQQELVVALQDMTLGKSRREALLEAAHRLNLPEFTSFIQTLNQAEVTGAPIGQVLRVQAEQVRIKRRQNAEAQAQRAPLLMLIPLIFFIFPSLFIVLLSPAAMTILEMLSNTSSLYR